MVWKEKEAFRWCIFFWLSLCMANLTYCFTDGCWTGQSFSRYFLIERLHPTDKIWLVLIICLAIIISYYHLVSLHEKNLDHYLLAVSHWLYKYICKSSLWNLGLKQLFQVICWNTNSTWPCYHITGCTCYHVVHVVHVLMSERAILELVNSVLNFFNMINLY